MSDTNNGAGFDILSDDFAQAAAQASRLARQNALSAGQSVVHIDAIGRYIEEHPDGRRFEIRLDSSQPRESHRILVREIVSHAV